MPVIVRQTHHVGQDVEVARHPQKGETGNQHAGDGARPEGHGKALGQAFRGRLGRPDVGADRDQHAHEAGEAGEDGADQKPEGRKTAQQGEKRHEDHGADNADRRVLTVEISLSALLNGRSDLLHARIAGRCPHERDRLNGAVKHRKEAGQDRQHDVAHSRNAPSKTERRPTEVKQLHTLLVRLPMFSRHDGVSKAAPRRKTRETAKPQPRMQRLLQPPPLTGARFLELTDKDEVSRPNGRP